MSSENNIFGRCFRAIRRGFSAMGIRQRFLMVFLLLVVLPTAVFIVVFTRSYYQYARSSVIERQISLLNQSGKSISTRLANYRNNSLMFYYNDAIMRFVNQEDFSNPSDEVESYLSSFVNTERNVLNATLLLNGADNTSAGRELLMAEKYIETHLPQVMAARGRPVLLDSHRMATNYYPELKAFALARAVNAPHKAVGSLWIFIDVEFFDDYLQEPGLLADDTVLYLLSEDGVMASSVPALTGTKLQAEWLQQALSIKEGYFSYKDQEMDTIITTAQVPHSGWHLVAVTPQASITRSLQHIPTMAGIIFGLYALFVIAMYLMLRKMMFQPITLLSRGLRKVSFGDFAYQLPRVADDEIGELTDTYNDMTEKIQSLMDDVRAQEQAKNKETIKVLSMQIGSHFLYNTLNTIRWMAVMNKQPQIRDMVVSLTKLLMSVTYHSGEEISLREELDLLRHYSLIQQARFANFAVHYDVPEQLLDLRVSKLILQPVIENSIQHGFSGRDAPGAITVAAVAKEGVLLLSVSDNGRGFNPSLIQWDVGQDDPVDHVGLRNIHQRLRLNYGEQYGLSIQSLAGQGTRVVLQLPVQAGKTQENTSLEREEKQ